MFIFVADPCPEFFLKPSSSRHPSHQEEQEEEANFTIDNSNEIRSAVLESCPGLFRDTLPPFGGLDDTPASCRAGGGGDGPAPPWVMCPPGSRRPGEAEGGPAPPIVVYPKAVPGGVKVWSASWPSRLQGRAPPHGTSNNIVLLP